MKQYSTRDYSLIFGMILFLLFDILFSAYHYYHLNLDGDLPKLAVPILWYEDVLNDPFGLKAVTQDVSYGGAGRYMCHQLSVLWCEYVFRAIHLLVKNPIVCVYLTTSCLATCIHLGFIWLMKQFVEVTTKLNLFAVLLVCCLTTVFIKYNKYYDAIGIIDRSASYAIFYALPLLLLAWFFLPFYKGYHTGQINFSIFQHVRHALLALFLAFSSPLTQPLVFLIVCWLIFFYLVQNNKSDLKLLLLNKTFLIHVSILLLLSVYAFYVSKFNSERNLSMPLTERYYLLLKGMYYLLTLSKAFFFIGILTSINIYFLFNNRKVLEFRKKLYLLIPLACVALSYLFLLPLGGYRSYRPYIVRYDTFLPITFFIAFFLVSTSIFIFTKLDKVFLKIAYGLTLILFIGIFTAMDINPEKSVNACQKKSLYFLHQHKDTVLTIPRECPLGTWSTQDFDDEQTQIMLTKLFRKWEIIQPYQTLH